MNFLQVRKYCVLLKEKAKFAYTPLGKSFEKQSKTIEDQGTKQVKAPKEHGKKFIESN